VNKVIAITILMLVSLSSVNANDIKGVKAYKKLCIKCHGGPFRASAMHTIDEWEDIEELSKTPFITLHKDLPDALEKFDNSMSEKRRNYIFKFLINNAKDSGAVPGCNGNYCGQN
jgi:hypothetical protein